MPWHMPWHAETCVMACHGKFLGRPGHFPRHAAWHRGRHSELELVVSNTANGPFYLQPTWLGKTYTSGLASMKYTLENTPGCREAMQPRDQAAVRPGIGAARPPGDQAAVRFVGGPVGLSVYGEPGDPVMARDIACHGMSHGRPWHMPYRLAPWRRRLALVVSTRAKGGPFELQPTWIG